MNTLPVPLKGYGMLFAVLKSVCIFHCSVTIFKKLMPFSALIEFVVHHALDHPSCVSDAPALLPKLHRPG